MTGFSEGLALFAVILTAFVFAGLQQLKGEVRRLSGQLDAIREKLGIAEAVKTPAEVFGLLEAGRKIEAIKVYREATGAGLAEAKAAVERIQAGAGPTAGAIISR